MSEALIAKIEASIEKEQSCIQRCIGKIEALNAVLVELRPAPEPTSEEVEEGSEDVE